MNLVKKNTFASLVGCTLAEKSIDWAGYTWFVRDDHNSGPGKLLFIEKLSCLLLIRR